MIRTLVLLLCLLPAQDTPRTGPETEKRFPALRVPPGFKATLFACDPLIEYPSVMSIGPRPDSVFLAHDYVTGLGYDIVRRSEIRRLEDTDGDGYADKSVVFAGGFNSIQGLAFHQGRVYVMHSPFLTSLRDTDGDGTADERRDLFEGLGWTPEKAPDRLHGANGVVGGHDGWLYLALGDRGADVRRPEGDRLVVNGGAILRCRPDGADLHVFAGGLRNIYDIALDEDLNVFVRDNENDGGTYMIRVCHSFFGADHGYPYLYGDRPREAMKPIADLARGSSAGGVCYLEDAFPEEYRGNLFFCEWGRSIVRYRRDRSGAGFAAPQEIEFASGAPNDLYGFKPTDLVVDSDGSLLVSDWADDQRPKRGRGRIYRIRAEGASAKPAPGLDSPRLSDRLAVTGRPPEMKTLGVLGRLHAIWMIARNGPEAIPTLLALAENDPEPRVRAQAVRAVADLTDPVLVKHRLDAGRGDVEIARRLSQLGRNEDPRVILEITVALGRLGWADAPAWLRENLSSPDPALTHAAQQTLRRSQNWKAVLQLLDGPLRPIALTALADRANAEVADGLLRRLESATDPAHRRDYVALLALIHRKSGPWVYWGFRPGPRPANTENWDRTDAIAAALSKTPADPDPSVRLAALRGALRENIPVAAPPLLEWLREERGAEAVAMILTALKDAPDIGPALADVVRNRDHAPANRLAALELAELPEAALLDLAASLEESAVLARVLRRIKDRNVLVRRARAALVEVRVAAIEAMAERGLDDPVLLALLQDKEAPARAAAAAAAGALTIRDAAEPLLSLTTDPDGTVRRRAFEALTRLREPRALAPALKALEDPEAELAALECVAQAGGPDHSAPVTALALRSRSLDVLQAAGRALGKWRKTEELARIQGASGTMVYWSTGPAAGSDSRVTVDGSATADFSVDEPFKAQFLVSSSGSLEVSLNGRVVHRREKAGTYVPDSDRFEADVQKGANRLTMTVSGSAQIHARFRRKSSVERHEALTQAALTRTGNVERGRALFLNAEKTACIKCHKLGDQGGRIGPELTGIGRRFSRVHLVEAVLEPSRVIAPAFKNYAVRLKDGTILSGVRISETDAVLTIGDTQGQTHALQKSRIDAEKMLDLSVMPEGLEKALTEREFVDLITFLAEQK